MRLLSRLIICGLLILMMGAISSVAAQGFWVCVDIKPQSCPNPLNIKSKGVLPVAILGTDEFDVMDVDPTTVMFEGEMGNVAALRWNYEDVSTPICDGGPPEPEECTDEGPDGLMDLTFKFDKQEVLEAIGPVNNGQMMIFLYFIGMTYDGRYFAGMDWVILKGYNH